ncbi:phosphatidate cytidylyltransferase [Gynuella sp.]|uniref:phosphatidate cytidylyltransferase n=1 Tax=Gynuella sp. TaxID=2969146 RepID=UPI003D0A48AF
MLKQRIITALVLAPIMVWGIFFLQLDYFALFTAIIVALGAWEWAHLSGSDVISERVTYTMGSLTLLSLCYVGQLYFHWFDEIVLWLALVWWLIASILVRSFPASSSHWRSPRRQRIMGLLVLVPMWVGLYQLKGLDHGNLWILFLMLVIWGADVGAYFAGKSFGRSKLAPNVSPGKTWEGVAGGLLTVYLVVTVAGLILSGDPDFTLSGWIVLFASTTLVVLFSIIGDLVESMVKRNRGVKDSSNLLPGHGGVMDRADSMCAAVPIFALALSLFPIG